MRKFTTLLAIMISLVFSAPVLATSVLPASLPYLSTNASLIFNGRVISNEVKLDEVSGRVATFTTFEVIELIKGNAGATHTIKQIGGQLPGSNRVLKIHGVPGFTVSEDYVVFLPEASELGFASPLGLSQGQFSIRQQNGVTTVSNGRDIDGLLSGKDVIARPGIAKLQSLPDDPASASLNEFIQTVRKLASE